METGKKDQMHLENFPAVQIIRDDDGRPRYAVLPWDEYMELKEMALGIDDYGIERFMPPEVAEAKQRGLSMIRAWREHLGLTQEETAQRMGVSRSTYARLEKSPSGCKRKDVLLAAQALGLAPEQITD